jgi:predicted ATP-binding protein involved in virulence
MLYLSKLKLQNFCNYIDHTFDFCKPNGEPFKFICLFAPNGAGKSSLLEAVSMLTMNSSSRSEDNVKRSLRKYIRNTDYNPPYEKISGHTYQKGMIDTYEDSLAEMVIEGTYVIDGKEYIVTITRDGVIRNDLITSALWGDNFMFYIQRIAHFVTSDNDLTLSKFQLRKEQSEAFEHITSTIMRFKTECVQPSGLLPMDQDYCTDFILHKNLHKIHYKRMSAGEKKISKSFSQLLNLQYDLANPGEGEIALAGWPPIILFDNVEMHIYYDRHISVIDCLKKYFPEQQIISTTHSGMLIERFLRGENDQENELMIDLEKINF